MPSNRTMTALQAAAAIIFTLAGVLLIIAGPAWLGLLFTAAAGGLAVTL